MIEMHRVKFGNPISKLDDKFRRFLIELRVIFGQTKLTQANVVRSISASKDAAEIKRKSGFGRRPREQGEDVKSMAKAKFI